MMTQRYYSWVPHLNGVAIFMMVLGQHADLLCWHQLDTLLMIGNKTANLRDNNTVSQNVIAIFNLTSLV